MENERESLLTQGSSASQRKRRVRNEEYVFTFSKEAELQGGISCCRFLVICLLVLISAAIPTLLILESYGILEVTIPLYDWAVYILVLNTSILMLMSRSVAGAISYPFSNSCFRTSMRNTNNARFSIEFRRSLDRMSEMIVEVMERQNHDASPAIFMELEKEQN